MQNIGGNVLLIKEVNVNIIKKSLKNLKTATKPQIAKATGLSTVTVGTILEILLKKNEINEMKQVKSNGGRPAQEFGYNFNYMNALILFPFEKENKTYISTDVVNLEGKSIYKNIAEVIGVNYETIKSIISNLINTYQNIKIIGFGNPGIEVNGKIIFSDYKELTNLNLSEEFLKEFNIPVIIENDVNAAVIGFNKRKCSEKKENLVYIYFPDKYPPGSGILINGEIYKGNRNYAGEIANIDGFLWNEKLYANFDEFCLNVGKIINIFSCILNPDVIILNGNFINETHIKTIKNYCKNSISESLTPELYNSENFLLDYRKGLIEKCLNELEPNISLVKREKLKGVEN